MGVACSADMEGEMRVQVFGREPEEKRPLGRPRRR
jgi:hypothetical protein